jgi:flagellar motility protein MotE (MotC chaperone)
MRIDFFGSILVVLIVTLMAKGFSVFGKIQKHTKYAFAISSHSVLMDVAHAESNAKSPPTEESAPYAVTKQEVRAEKHTPDQVETKSNLPQLDNNLSSDEVKLLKELSRRRDELNRAQEALQMRENVLSATESKLNQKMHDLQSLNAQVEEAMKTYQEKESGKIKSLVRIYENMKPKDAAKIFDALEMPILLDIVSRMKETKVSPILAAMHTGKASDLSVELTKQRDMLNASSSDSRQ